MLSGGGFDANCTLQVNLKRDTLQRHRLNSALKFVIPENAAEEAGDFTPFERTVGDSQPLQTLNQPDAWWWQSQGNA